MLQPVSQKAPLTLPSLIGVTAVKPIVVPNVGIGEITKLSSQGALCRVDGGSDDATDERHKLRVFRNSGLNLQNQTRPRLIQGHHASPEGCVADMSIHIIHVLMRQIVDKALGHEPSTIQPFQKGLNERVVNDRLANVIDKGGFDENSDKHGSPHTG